LSGQSFELVELALANLEPSDTVKLTHCSALQFVDPLRNVAPPV
jgi:hypothetical protein